MPSGLSQVLFQFSYMKIIKRFGAKRPSKRIKPASADLRAERAVSGAVKLFLREAS